MNLTAVALCAMVVGAAVAVCWVMVARYGAPAWTRRDWAGAVGLGVVIAGAAADTFHGLHSLAIAAAFPWWVAVTLPLLLDGAALLATRAFVDTTLRTSTRWYALGIALVLAVGSVVGNVASVLVVPAPPGAPTGVRVVLAVVPPLALILVGTLRHLVREDLKALVYARAEHQTAVELATETAAARRQAEDDSQRATTAAHQAAEQHRDTERRLAETSALEVAAEQATIYASYLAHQEQHEASLAQAARDARFAAVAEAPQPPVAPARPPAKQRTRKPRDPQPQTLAQDVAAAKPVLAEESLGRPALAKRFGWTQNRARKVLDAIAAEQAPASADPLEAAWSAPAAAEPRANNGHRVRTAAGGEP